MFPIPHEISLSGVYLSPMLVAAAIGLAGAAVTARLLNRLRLSRYFFYPPLVFLAMTVLYTVAVGTWVIGI